MPRGPLTVLAELEARGIWVGSLAGFSFHCGCGWVSPREPSMGDVEERLVEHAKECSR